MNRTIKDATVRRFCSHLADFVQAYNFAKRLKTLRDVDGKRRLETLDQLLVDDIGNPKPIKNARHRDQHIVLAATISGTYWSVTGSRTTRASKPRRLAPIARSADRRLLADPVLDPSGRTAPPGRAVASLRRGFCSMRGCSARYPSRLPLIAAAGCGHS
jgi:hypothetical protein